MTNLNGIRDTSDVYRNLLAARGEAKAIAKLRPDLKFLCATVAENTKLQMREPDNSDFQRAGELLVQEIAKRIAAHPQ